MTVPVIESYTTQGYQFDNAAELTKPTGLANGDILLWACYFEDASANAVTYPTGFIERGLTDGKNGLAMGLVFATKVITDAPSEPASYTFTFPTASIGHTACLMRISNVDTSTPIDAAAVWNNAIDSSPTNAGVTTATADALVINVFGSYRSGRGPDQPAGFSTLVNIATDIQVIYTKGQTAPGATGTISNGSLSASTEWITGTIAVRAAGVPGASTGPGIVVGQSNSYVGEGAIGAPQLPPAITRGLTSSINHSTTAQRLQIANRSSVIPVDVQVFSDDFERSVGSGWGNGWDTSHANISSSSVNGSEAVLTGDGTNTVIVAYNDLLSAIDTWDVLVKWRYTAGPDGARIAISKGSGNPGLVFSAIPWNGSNSSILNYKANMAWSDDGSSSTGSSGNLSTNTWYWVRFTFDGTTVRSRMWADGNSEPGSWQITWTAPASITAFDSVSLGTQGGTTVEYESIVVVASVGLLATLLYIKTKDRSFVGLSQSHTSQAVYDSGAIVRAISATISHASASLRELIAARAVTVAAISNTTSSLRSLLTNREIIVAAINNSSSTQQLLVKLRSIAVATINSTSAATRVVVNERAITGVSTNSSTAMVGQKIAPREIAVAAINAVTSAARIVVNNRSIAVATIAVTTSAARVVIALRAIAVAAISVTTAADWTKSNQTFSRSFEAAIGAATTSVTRVIVAVRSTSQSAGHSTSAVRVIVAVRAIAVASIANTVAAVRMVINNRTTSGAVANSTSATQTRVLARSTTITTDAPTTVAQRIGTFLRSTTSTIAHSTSVEGIGGKFRAVSVAAIANVSGAVRIVVNNRAITGASVASSTGATRAKITSRVVAVASIAVTTVAVGIKALSKAISVASIANSTSANRVMISTRTITVTSIPVTITVSRAQVSNRNVIVASIANTTSAIRARVLGRSVSVAEIGSTTIVNFNGEFGRVITLTIPHSVTVTPTIVQYGAEIPIVVIGVGVYQLDVVLGQGIYYSDHYTLPSTYYGDVELNAGVYRLDVVTDNATYLGLD